MRQVVVFLIILAGIGFPATAAFGAGRDQQFQAESRLEVTQPDLDEAEVRRAKAFLEQLRDSAEGQFIIVRENNFADEWPERFRSSDMPLELSEEQLKGLRELRIMGGGQLSEIQLRNIIARSEYPVIVLDFRQEPHGHIGGMPITWFRPYVSDVDLGTDEMITLESDFIEFLGSTASIRVDSVNWTGGQNYALSRSDFVKNDTVLTDASMVERNGARYVRFYVPVVPNDLQVEEFESLVEEFSEQDVILYFQCWDGTGRSSAFMVMYDILHNGHEVSLEAIADRQAALGGINVLELPAESSPNYARSVVRRDFIIDYYRKKTKTE